MFENKYKSPLNECVRFVAGCKKEFVIDDTPYILGPEEKAFKITEKRIFPLPKCNDFRKLGFVDGGNAPLIKSSDFTICINRVAGVVVDKTGTKELQSTPHIIEFYSATVLKSSEDETLEIVTKFFPREPSFQEYLPERAIVLNISDPSIRNPSGFLMKIETIAGIARRFTEWTYAAKFIENELNEGDIFVRDGSLQTGFTGETEVAKSFYKTGLTNKIYITGLSKTCRLFTKNGDSLISIINEIALKKFKNQSWYYHPIFRITKADNQADLYFAKFHETSPYPFRFDIYIEQSKRLEQEERELILSNIAHNSNDFSFPGYPYGLIKADQLSRIAKSELESLKIQLLTEFSRKDYRSYILPRLRSVDAHDILNKIRK